MISCLLSSSSTPETVADCVFAVESHPEAVRVTLQAEGAAEVMAEAISLFFASPESESCSTIEGDASVYAALLLLPATATNLPLP